MFIVEYNLLTKTHSALKSILNIIIHKVHSNFSRVTNFSMPIRVRRTRTRVCSRLRTRTRISLKFSHLVYGQFRHTISIAMPYRCSKCSLCFNDSHLLQVHMKTNQCLPKVPWDVQSVLILDDVRHGPFLFTDRRPKINYLYTDILQNQ